jgi:hypothetical protein
MACPVLPLTPPISTLEQLSHTATSPKQAWKHLTTVMHVGLSHFSGRRFPTIMDTVLGKGRGDGGSGGKGRMGIGSGPTAEDARLIKGWANELDGWLLRYHKPSSERTSTIPLTKADPVHDLSLRIPTKRAKRSQCHPPSIPTTQTLRFINLSLGKKRRWGNHPSNSFDRT